MSAEENMELVQDVLWTIWDGDLSIMEEHPGMHESIPTWQQIMAAFTDSEYEIVQQFSDGGEWVATRILTETTHTGEFMGQPPTGERITVETIMFHRVVDGLIVEQRAQGNPI